MGQFEKTLKKFDYQLPKELIAQAPASPRESARLLVYQAIKKKVSYDTFLNIGKYLPKNCVLVFNQTKVLPARLPVVKETGGKADILYIGHDSTYIQVLSNRKLPVGSSIILAHDQASTLRFMVIKREDGFYYLRPNFAASRIASVLKRFGITPLPPYINRSPLSEMEIKKQYQSVFAKKGLSVAAPTASLHFTKKLAATLTKQGIAVRFVTLNVGLGTFAPLKEHNLQQGILHSEEYEIDTATAKFLNAAKKMGRPIIAVGTTVTRTLESAAINGKLTKLKGQTNIFIQEHSQINFVDALVTNFHVPESSLLMLVSAFIGRKRLFELYKLAIHKKFRFFSFGDGMLIIP